MEGYCGVSMRTAEDEAAANHEPDQEPQDGCWGLLEPYLDQIATELIAAQVERDGDQEDALDRWFWEGGR